MWKRGERRAPFLALNDSFLDSPAWVSVHKYELSTMHSGCMVKTAAATLLEGRRQTNILIIIVQVH